MTSGYDVEADLSGARSGSRYYPEDAGYGDSPKGAGWLTFATIMLALSGTFSVIDGIVAVSKSKFFTPNAVYVFSDLKTWGWIVLILGVLELVAAGAIFGGSQAARWFGIAAAGLNALGQLLFVQAYPWWSVAAFATDVVIIYALAAYAGPRLREL
jgi:hypothetical protein